MSATSDVLELFFRKRKVGFAMRTEYLLAIDCIGAVAAFTLSQLILRESFDAAVDLLRSFWPQALISVFLRISLNQVFGLYGRLWRYASIPEVVQVLKSSALAFFCLAIVDLVVLRQLHLPSISSMSFLLLDWFFNLAFISGSRFCLRIGINWLTVHNKQILCKLSPSIRVLIMGAGDSGSMLIRVMLENPELGYIPVGIADDDPGKQSLRVYGIPVLGKRQDIPRLVKALKISEVIVALPSAPQQAIQAIRTLCAQASVQLRIAPDIRAVVSGRITFDHLRQWRSSLMVVPPCPFCVDYRFHDILVTGGAGFIGSNFARYMLSNHPDYRIIVFDKLTYAGNLHNLHGLKRAFGDRFVFIRGDICDSRQLKQVMQSYGIDAIVNFAAETHVDRSLLEPDVFLQTNTTGTLQLLEAARQYRISRFHQVSTDEVYGQVLCGSFGEEDPLETRSPYSASKAAADLLVHAYFNSFGVPATITRCSNNIGPYQYPEKAVPLFITNALENKPLPIYGDGCYVRDYQYVVDHCRGIDLVLHKGTLGEIYNLGSGTEVEALTLAKMILDRLEKPYSMICFVNDRKGQDRRYSLNCAKIRTLGWAPQWSFDKALDATVAWYHKNEWWWRKLKSGEYRIFYESQYHQRLKEAVRWSINE